MKLAIPEPVVKIPTGRLPDIFVAGFPKCGSTSLYAFLDKHLDISGAVWRDLGHEEDDSRRAPYRPQKEHYFFSRDDNYSNGLEWYARHFRTDRKHAIDGTPTYAADERALKRMRDAVPEARILIIMREPVARAFSAWNHWNQLPEHDRWKMFFPTGSFEENVFHEMELIDTGRPAEGFLGHSLYVPHLKMLEHYFPREQIFYEFSARLRLDFRTRMRKIFDFLGVIPIPIHYHEANKRDYTVAPLPVETREEMRAFFRPFDGELEEFLGERLPWVI